MTACINRLNKCDVIPLLMRIIIVFCEILADFNGRLKLGAFDVCPNCIYPFVT